MNLALSHGPLGEVGMLIPGCRCVHSRRVVHARTSNLRLNWTPKGTKGSRMAHACAMSWSLSLLTGTPGKQRAAPALRLVYGGSTWSRRSVQRTFRTRADAPMIGDLSGSNRPPRNKANVHVTSGGGLVSRYGIQILVCEAMEVMLDT